MPSKRPAPGSAPRGQAFKTSSHKRARTDGADSPSSSRGRGRGGSSRGGSSRGGGGGASRGGSSRGGAEGGRGGRGGGRGGAGRGRGGGRGGASSVEKVYKIDWRSKPKPAPTSDDEAPAQTSKKGSAKGPKAPVVAPAPAPLPPRSPAQSFRIMCGSYERHLYGLHVTSASGGSAEGELKLDLKPIFIFPAHPSAIASVAAAGQGAKWGASGAGEDVVKVWDLRRKVEVGILQGHTGVITSLSFPTRTYLLSASSSGELNIYRTRDWALLRTLRGHTGAIRAVAAHPGARLALSIGDDAHLRAWDLMRAKAAGSVRLALDKTEVPEDVRWSLDGETFAVLARGAMLLFDSAMRQLACLRTPRESPRTRGTCIAFAAQAREANCGLLLLGTEDGKVKVYKLPDAQERRTLIEAKDDDEDEVETAEKGLTLLGTLVGHKNRVKSLSTQAFALPSGGDTEVAISISSDGFVRVFDLASFYDALSSNEASEQIEVHACGAYDTKGARLTCLTSVSGDGALEKGKGAEQDDDEEEEDEELLGSDDSQDEEGEEEEEELGSDDEVELDEDEEEELELLKEQVRQARAAGVVVEGMSEVESDDDDEDSEVEGEDEDEDEEA